MPLGLLEGYEVIAWRGEWVAVGSPSWSGLRPGYGMGFNKWLDWPNDGPCAGKYLAFGALVSNVVEYVATNCQMTTREEWLHVDNPYYPSFEDCVDDPVESAVHWYGEPGPPVAVVTNQLEMGASGLPRGMGWTRETYHEQAWNCTLGTGVTALVHGVAWRRMEGSGELKFVAPFYYGPDTPVIFTLEGVSASGVALSNLLLWGHSPIAVDETTGNVSYLLLMTGGQVYSIVESNFNHQAAISTGTNSWPYDCALMTYSNSVKSIGFTGFHNQSGQIRLVSELWWFGGESPSGYAVQTLLIGPQLGDGDYRWEVTAGLGLVELVNGSMTADVITIPNQRSVLVNGTGSSLASNDVTISLQFNGKPIGSRSMTVFAPAKVVVITGTPVDVPAGNGYATHYLMEVRDQFNQRLPRDVGVNETGGFFIRDNLLSNWLFPDLASGDMTGHPFGVGQFPDSYIYHDTAPGTSSPSPVNPGEPGSSEKIYNAIQTYRAGSDVSGRGVVIKTHKLQYYRGKARQE